MIPKIHLADPDIEPSDEDFVALSAAALETAIERREIARAGYEQRLRIGPETASTTGNATSSAVRKPVLIAIAGPNGSGKTTLAESALRPGPHAGRPG